MARRSPTLQRLASSFELSLRAQNRSERTVEAYMDALRFFTEFNAAHGGPTEVRAIRREHVEAFIADQLARLKPSSASTRYRALRVFFVWCEEEGEIDVNPMARMKPPIIPDTPPPVLTEVDVRKLLKTCAGASFLDRRDNAIIRLLYDTGIRISECAGLAVDDVDLGGRMVRVLGKGRRPRAVPFGLQTARAVDRYIRTRDSHPYADTAALWLANTSRSFGRDGVRQMLERRGKQAGVDVHAHLFRHTFAHEYLANDGNEGDLMYLTGWKSRQMLTRYGASAAAERARSNYTSPGDRL